MSIVLVPIVELINSAIEATVDRISLENHKLAKRAKDIGSASVLLSLINVFAVAGLVLLSETLARRRAESSRLRGVNPGAQNSRKVTA